MRHTVIIYFGSRNMSSSELIEYVLANRFSPDGQEHSVSGLLFFGQGYHYTSNHIALRCYLTQSLSKNATYYLDDREVGIVLSYLIGLRKNLVII